MSSGVTCCAGLLFFVVVAIIPPLPSNLTMLAILLEFVCLFDNSEVVVVVALISLVVVALSIPSTFSIKNRESIKQR